MVCVSATDPVTLVGVALLLIIAASAGRYFSARRAATVDNVVAPRAQ
jgi:hypothetical protein